MTYCTPAIERKALKAHTCTYCGQPIEAGDKYMTWKSVGDSWFTNKMHHECADDLSEWGEGEYSPFTNDRPIVLANGGEL